ncbi:MAG: hypothetical protein GWN79_03770, partial [Actinobacteria bacterium]|nr:hypothetical protein [Actinomycetota bacterium]NIS35798.1 hypothetical protein [Actinomycetota bacterium]NIT94645.1 hypothetical protein [Actinomycetota bacterium]NIU18255.1 hypothetical protein [Actinomycetota bacterium]NIU70428.1 hypothetical protein [Actinomycetota bacterium]
AELRRDEATRRAKAMVEGGAAGELAARVPRGQGGPVPIVVVMGEAPASRLDVVLDLP